MNKKGLDKMVKNGQFKKLHTSTFRGYVSRKSEGIVEKYNGKFGKGFTLKSPNFDSTSVAYITYFVEVWIMRLCKCERDIITPNFLNNNVTYKNGLTWLQIKKLGNGEDVKTCKLTDEAELLIMRIKQVAMYPVV